MVHKCETEKVLQNLCHVIPPFMYVYHKVEEMFCNSELWLEILMDIFLFCKVKLKAFL